MSGCPTCPWHTEDKSPLDARGTPPHVVWTVNHPPNTVPLPAPPTGGTCPRDGVRTLIGWLA